MTWQGFMHAGLGRWLQGKALVMKCEDPTERSETNVKADMATQEKTAGEGRGHAQAWHAQQHKDWFNKTGGENRYTGTQLPWALSICAMAQICTLRA